MLFCVLQVGYIVTSCLLNENHDFLRLAINTVRNDIIGRNETFQCLALTLVRVTDVLLLFTFIYENLVLLFAFPGKEFFACNVMQLWFFFFFFHIFQILIVHVYTQVGNIGGREFAESLAPDVQKLLVSDTYSIERVSLKLRLTLF